MTILTFGLAVIASGCTQPTEGGRPPEEVAAEPVSPTPHAPADTGWRDDLPLQELLDLIQADLDGLAAKTHDANAFRTQARVIQNEALAVALYAQIGLSRSDANEGKRFAVLRNAALRFAEAAREKNPDAARAAVPSVDVKSGEEIRPRSAHISLTRLIPMTNLMEHAGNFLLTVPEYEELTPAKWAEPETKREIMWAMWKLTALMRATEAHTPATDPNPRKGQTVKLWADTSRQSIDATGGAFAAIRAGRHEEFSAAVQRVVASCAACHKAYRVE